MMQFATKLMRKLSAETAHGVTIKLLTSGLGPSYKTDHPMLVQDLWGLNFTNPIGMAAGFDKNADVPLAVLNLGFGFTEIGTVTPLPQKGNPKPRLFRLSEDLAVINRMGFNNKGVDVALTKMRKHRQKQAQKNIAGLIGVNVGKNKDSVSAVDDYVLGIKKLGPYADFLVVNVSSPNTPGLRDLQHKDHLETLLKAVMAARAELLGKKPPVLLKVAPDLKPSDITDIAQVVMAQKIDGLIVSNTTVARPPALSSAHREEQGGLSGRPLFKASTEILRQFYQATGGHIPLIGVGGVSTPQDAYDKIKAGARLVQLYTGMVYRGPDIAKYINDGLVQLLQEDGYGHILDAVGADFKENTHAKS